MSLARPFIAMLISSVVFTATGGCQTFQTNNAEKGTLLGALAGAGLGAAIGDGRDAAGPGALIGAGVGAISGAVIGGGVDRQVENNRYAVAQQYQQAAAQQQIAVAQSGAVSPEDIIAMARAGLSEQVIAGQIRANGVSRPLNVNDLINLRNQGVPDGAIQAMQTAGPPRVANTAAVANVAPVMYAPAPAPIVVEQYYAGPGWYGPRPYWGPPPYYYHRHCGPPPPRVSWGVSFSR